MNRRRTKRVNKKAVEKKNFYTRVYGPLKTSQSFQPRWMTATMRYSETFSQSVAVGSNFSYIYNANSLYDPNRTGVGHQPRGFDQLTPLYNRYRVDKFSYVVQFGPSGLDYGVCVGVVNGINTFTTILDLAEASRSISKVVSYAGSSVSYKGKVSLHNVLGRSREAYHIDDVTGGTATTSPSEVIGLYLVIENPATNAGAITAYFTVNLVYEAVFYDYIMPGES